MITAIKKTLSRLSGKIYGFNPVVWYPVLLEGVAVEFNRLREYKNNVLSATVPSEQMTPDSIDDHNRKYGIPSTLSGTDAVKIGRIIEKAALDGYPGPDWIEEQIQKAGYLLYVHENEILTQSIKLVVGSTPSGGSKPFLSQLGSFQLGDYQIGTPDFSKINPQPFIYTRTDDPTRWGYYFTLSPFPDRMAVDSSEFLEVPENDFNYLCNLIIEISLQRNWCILQAKAS
jgi:hypothetical protein